MNKKPHIAFTPQEELTAPMPLPQATPMPLPQAVPIPVAAPLIETVRITPPGVTVGDLTIKAPEVIPGVTSGELRPKQALFSTKKKATPPNRRPTEPYGPVLDSTAFRGELHNDESVIVEAIDDEVSSGAPRVIDDTLDGSGDRTSAVAMVDLPNEMKATILFWLVNLAREQGLGLSKTRHKQAIEMERIMEMDPVYHDYSMDEMLKEHHGSEPQHINVKTRGGKKTKLHTVELTVNDWPRFEQWMKIQAENNFRDMSMLDMLDAEIRVAAWEYLTRFSHMVREKLSHGYAMFRDNQPVPLLDLLRI